MKIELVNPEQLLFEMPERIEFRCNSLCTQHIKDFVKQNPNVNSAILDFKNTVYIDSSGLGMMLVLRDIIGKDIKFVNVNKQCKQIFFIANFHKLFKID